MEAPASFTVPIEEVPLGSRIATKNPEPWTVTRSVAPGDEANLRVIVAEVLRDDGTHVGIELLRSVECINQLGLVENSRLYMELAELNVAGWVQVHSIEPCPPLCEGPGNLVTGRFVTVQAANIVRATFSDGTIITGTDIHPVWSLDKQDWVPLGELSFGEHVHSNAGPLSLIDREVITRPQDVYNIEVDGEHVYQVGDSGVLVHNACATRGFSRVKPRLETGNLKEGWTHVDARHITGNHPKGAGDLFPSGTSQSQITRLAELLVKKGNRISDPSKLIQTYQLRTVVNNMRGRFKVVVDSSDGNRIITIFPVITG